MGDYHFAGCLMRCAGTCVLLALAAGLVGCRSEAPAPEENVAEPPEQFVRAPVPKNARPKLPFGPPAAYPKAPDADRAVELLDTAIAKVWDLADPRDLLTELFRVMAEADGAKVPDRVRAASLRLEKMKLPPSRRVVWQSLAECVAPWDQELRDDLLHRAIAEARASLKNEELWKLEPGPRVVLRDDPQRLRNYEKQIMELHVRLWEAVLKQQYDRAAAVGLAEKLFADAKALGECPLGCLIRMYDSDLAQDLAGLDPLLLLEALPKVWDKENVAQFCAGEASHRWGDRQRDAITGVLVLHALGQGIATERVAEVAAYYDTRKCWELIVKLPDDANNPNFPRLRPLSLLLTVWAWKDPDGALEAAESEKGDSTRRAVLTRVAEVWAYKRPDQIERAVKNLDNDYERKRIRKAAADELEWRKQGNPPRDNRLAAQVVMRPWSFSPRPVAGRKGAHPDAIRVLNHPKETDWLKGDTRVARLREAAEIAYFEADPPEAFWEIIAQLPGSDQPDEQLHQTAESTSRFGSPAEAIVLMQKLKTNRQYAYTATWVARGMVRRAEGN